jgi:hypothetical protein
LAQPLAQPLAESGKDVKAGFKKTIRPDLTALLPCSLYHGFWYPFLAIFYFAIFLKFAA